jgi:hypothetical protein
MHTMQLNRSAPMGGVGTVQPAPTAREQTRAASNLTPPVSGLAAALGIRLMAYAMGEFHPATNPTVTYRRRPSLG